MIKKIITLILFCGIYTSYTVIAQDKECKSSCADKNVKYMFFFIGDGMGLAQASLAEAYTATQNGEISNVGLTFTKFPVIGLATTYSASSYITCSSAAGTALSTGIKTNNGILGLDPSGKRLESITYPLHKSGKKIGIISSVTMDHATPAAFYAASSSRNNYYDIAIQLPETGFEFFGGGGFIQPNGKKDDKTNIYKILNEKGYKIVKGINSPVKYTENDKVIFLQEEGKEGDLPFAIDRKEGDLTLKMVLDKAINHLYNKEGFFIMAEGGKIDWACHSNDAKTALLEVIDMDEAIRSAYQFYLEHPDETLIIVTADHETGGLALGREGYVLNLKALEAQTNSLSVDSSNPDKYKQINKEARVGWTTKAHTGIAVPVYAIGKHSDLFGGRMDNTEIPKKILKAMGLDYKTKIDE